MKNTILIKNVNLISLAKNAPKIQNNIDILIENEKIAKISKNIKGKFNKIIDGTNRYVIPGFINSHSHVAMGLFRNTVTGLTLQKWLNELIWPIEARFSGNDVAKLTRFGIGEMIENGITSTNDMYFFPNEMVNEAKKIGFNMYWGWGLLNIDGDDKGNKRFNEYVKFLGTKDGLQQITFTIHGLYTSTTEYLKKVLEYPIKKKLVVHMHFCENLEEAETIKKMHKVKYPSDVLLKYFSKVKLVLAHTVHLTDYDIKALAKLNASCVHCPISNMRLGCGVSPITKMVKAGINVCLGTDGQGSGDNFSMFELMRIASYLQKGVNADSNLLDSYDALKMATINGAKALGIENKTGSIEVGKNADLNILFFRSINMYPINNPIDNIVYNATDDEIETTIINGKIVREKNNFVNLKKDELLNSMEQIRKNMSKYLEKAIKDSSKR